MLRYLTAAESSEVLSRLMRKQRQYNIEYGGFLSNHAVWVAVCQFRTGVPEVLVEENLTAYNKRVGTVAALAPPQKVDNSSDLNHAVGMLFEGYSELLARFDAEIAAELERTNGDVPAALDSVCSRHLPRVVRGVAAAAFHPLLHLGAAMEGRLPSVAAEALAYMHVRCWREADTFENPVDPSEPGHPAALINTLKQWVEKRCGDLEGLREVLEGEKGDTSLLVSGGFQRRNLRCLRMLQELKDVPVRFSPGGDLQRQAAWLFIYAAAALSASDNEFFVLHGLTSLWATWQILIAAPSLPDAARRDLLASWLRCYYAAYAAQGLPGLDALLSLTPAFLQGDFREVVEKLRSVRGVADLPTWDDIVRKAQPYEEEHTLKAVWMMKEMLPQCQAAVDEEHREHVAYILQDASRRLAFEIPSEYARLNQTLRFASPY